MMRWRMDGARTVMGLFFLAAVQLAPQLGKAEKVSDAARPANAPSAAQSTPKTPGGGGRFDGWPEGMQDAVIRLIRLQYDGAGWDDGMDAVSRADLNFLEAFHQLTNFKVARQAESHSINMLGKYPQGYAPPFVFMTGNGDISVSEREVEVLREYLLNGGMLFADCSSPKWGHSFTNFMGRVFPDQSVQMIADDDPLFQKPYSFTNGAPALWHHAGKRVLGIKHNNRWVVYFHPGNIHNAWKTGHSDLDPEMADAAIRAGVNVVHYAFTNCQEQIRRYRDLKAATPASSSSAAPSTPKASGGGGGAGPAMKVVAQVSACATSGGALTPAFEEQQKALHARCIAAIDLDVSLPKSGIEKWGAAMGIDVFEKKANWRSGSFTIPGGSLLYFPNGVGLVYAPFGSFDTTAMHGAKETEAHTLKMGFLKTDDDRSGFWSEDVRRGYAILHGEEAYRKLVEAQKAGDCTNAWVEDLELCMLSEIAELSGTEWKYSAEQLEKIRDVLAKYRGQILALESLYRRLRKTEVNNKDAQALFATFNQLRTIEREISSLKESSDTPDQRRYKKRKSMATGSYCASGGSAGRFSLSLRGQNGKWTLGVNFPRQSSQDLLTGYLDICDKHLGELVVCVLDPGLKSKIVQANELRCHSIEEGLDQIAKLVGGKLEKDGAGWVIRQTPGK